MAISAFSRRDLEKFFPGALDFLEKHSSVQDVASKALLGVAAFFTVHVFDKVLKNYFLEQGVKGQVLPSGEGFIHSLIEQTCYSVILRTPSDFFSSDALNRIMQVSRFCVSFLLGATAARSLGFSSKVAFSQDIIAGFCFAICREGSLLALPKNISSSVLMVTDAVISSLAEVCPKGGLSLDANEWYYKALTRGIFQIVAGCTTFSGSPLPAFIQQGLFNLTRSL